MDTRQMDQEDAALQVQAMPAAQELLALLGLGSADGITLVRPGAH